MNGYDQDEYYEDETEDAIDECGLDWKTSRCSRQGEEHCSFWCPFHKVMIRGMRFFIVPFSGDVGFYSPTPPIRDDGFSRSPFDDDTEELK